MFATLLGTCLLVTACSSDADHELSMLNKGDNVISLSSGETLLLTDTTTYELEFDEALATCTNSYYEDCFSPQTRGASDSYRAYGFDSEEPETGWRKYALGKDWKQYGISPGTYIGRYIRVHKNLSILPNKTIVVANYNSVNAPQNAMGWYGTTKTIGFSATPSTDYIADGVTRVFYINCNLSGISYNKYIPALPSNFEWAYRLIDMEDVW